MDNLPSWLPEMLKVNPWTDETFEMLYGIFEKDFKRGSLNYKGSSVWFFPDMDDGREEIFWHLTHRKDKSTGTRFPDLRRSERLPWAKPMIENPDKVEVWAWDFKEHDGRIITYVWLKDHDYLVLMKKFKNGTRRIMTSYFIDFPNKKRKLEKKYRKRLTGN